jgi:hypothetical protein
MMANPTEADLKPGYKSVESPKSHHTGGTGLSGGDVFVDGNPNYQITRGSDIGTGAGGIGTGKHHHSGLGDSSTRDSGYSDGNTSGLGSGRGNEYSNENTRTGVTGDENLTGGRAAGTDGLPSSHYDRSGASHSHPQY